MRGALISPFAADGKSFSVLGDIPVEASLRSALLYWDSVKLAIFARGMAPKIDGLAQFLVDEGAGDYLYLKDKNSFSTSELGILAGSFLDLVENTARRPDEVWSVVCPIGNYQGTSQFLAKLADRGSPKLQTKKLVLELAFTDALPAPPPDTAFQDIIHFKRQRADKLQELQHAIEMLSASLSGTEEIAEALTVGQNEISKVLNDIDRIFGEKWPKRLYKTLRTSIGSIAVGAVGGALAAGSLDIPLVVAAGLGAGAKPLLSAALTTIIGDRKLPERATPYIYAYEAQQRFNR